MSLDKWFAEINGEEGYPTDAEATEAYFEAAYHGPIDTGSIDTGVTHVTTPARLLSRQVALTAREPQFVLPSDPNRLRVDVSPVNEALSYRIASDKNDVAFAALCIGAWHNNYHTGAVWLMADQDMTLSVTATTC